MTAPARPLKADRLAADRAIAACVRRAQAMVRAGEDGAEGEDDAWDEAWDAFHETLGARCCDCPSCNFYLPEGEYKPGTQCVMVAAIERIVAARIASHHTTPRGILNAAGVVAGVLLDGEAT